MITPHRRRRPCPSKTSDYAQEGQIVVALMEEEATLKRYYPEPEKQGSPSAGK
jgi:hypothetical protein